MIRPSPHALPSLPALPLEIQLQVSSYLSYPDALALKHTSRHFYHLVDTGVRLKVAWLIDRKRLRLDHPKEYCSLKTDEAFCSSREIRRIMERRRRHGECKGGACKVVEGMSCGGQRGRRLGVGSGMWKGGFDGATLVMVWLVALSVAVLGLWLRG